MIRDRTRAIKRREERGEVITEEEKQRILNAPVKPQKPLQNVLDSELTPSQLSNRKTWRRQKANPEAMATKRKWDVKERQKFQNELRDQKEAEKAAKYASVLREQSIWEQNQPQAGPSKTNR